MANAYFQGEEYRSAQRAMISGHWPLHGPGKPILVHGAGIRRGEPYRCDMVAAYKLGLSSFSCVNN